MSGMSYNGKVFRVFDQVDVIPPDKKILIQNIRGLPSHNI